MDPEVTVSVAEFRVIRSASSDPSKTPGVIQLNGPKTLSEVLSLSGGANPDAGNTIIITRRKDAGPLPLPTLPLMQTVSFTLAT